MLPTATVEDQKPQTGVVTLSTESMEQLAVMIEAKIEEGLRRKLNEETAQVFWNAGLKMLRQEAGDKALKFGWWGVKQIVGKIIVFTALGWLVYALGGWDGLTRFLRMLLSKDVS